MGENVAEAFVGSNFRDKQHPITDLIAPMYDRAHKLGYTQTLEEVNGYLCRPGANIILLRNRASGVYIGFGMQFPIVVDTMIGKLRASYFARVLEGDEQQKGQGLTLLQAVKWLNNPDVAVATSQNPAALLSVIAPRDPMAPKDQVPPIGDWYPFRRQYDGSLPPSDEGEVVLDQDKPGENDLIKAAIAREVMVGVAQRKGVSEGLLNPVTGRIIHLYAEGRANAFDENRASQRALGFRGRLQRVYDVDPDRGDAIVYMEFANPVELMRRIRLLRAAGSTPLTL